MVVVAQVVVVEPREEFGIASVGAVGQSYGAFGSAGHVIDRLRGGVGVNLRRPQGGLRWRLLTGSSC